MEADALLAATYRGDTGAFESLVRSQAGRLHRLAARVTGDEILADDVVQETFLRVLRVPPAARPTRRAAAWLARVTVRVALNALESERARRRREERYATERSREMKDGTPASQAAPGGDLDRRVAEALASLAPLTRAALWLHVVEGEGVREVAACLESSRSAVSRRIRAGLESLRARLGTSGAALTGVAALRGTLEGAGIPPAESLIRRIVDAGRPTITGATASAPGPDALDAALAAPVRSLPPGAVIGTAAVLTIVLSLLAALGARRLLWPEGEPGGKPAGPVVLAPVAPPAARRSIQDGEVKAPEPIPAPTAPRSASLAGTLWDEGEAPVASADVYLALTPPGEEDLLVSLGSYFRADYFRRSRVLRARTDPEGRYRFEGIREFGDARLAAFKEGHGDPRTAGSRHLQGVKLEEGAELTGIDLVLPEGKTLAGRLLGPDGSPVSDAVISVPTAWSPKDHIFWPAGLGLSDEDGRFRLGFEARAAACHLRVSSERCGQHFFVEVPVADEEVELTLDRPARVEGTITWADGAAATGLTVRVNGRLPEPPIPVERMGLRSHVVHDGRVGEDGAYIIDGLHPRLDHDIFVIDVSLGEPAALKDPLTPRLRHTFRLEPGEVKTWDHVVQRPITIRGRIRTEATGAPVREAQVAVLKDGKRLTVTSDWADAEGFFELRLTTGAGEYRLHAEPPVGFPSADDAGDLIDERFGRTLHVSNGREAEVDLTIFEPVVLPLRVLDPAGKPPRSVHGQLHVTFPNGRKMTHETPLSLDDTGRTRISLYYPVAELRYEASSERGGPTAETSRHAGSPGSVLPEETIVLPRTCGLTAVVRDASGKPRSESWIRLRVAHEDGSRQDLTSRTDGEGRLNEAGRVKAAAFVVEIRSADSRVLWSSRWLDGSSGQAIDLGDIILDDKEGPAR
jgi:RNA polymerase sigma-70 factor (ECF subfamily)